MIHSELYILKREHLEFYCFYFIVLKFKKIIIWIYGQNNTKFLNLASNNKLISSLIFYFYIFLYILFVCWKIFRYWMGKFSTGQLAGKSLKFSIFNLTKRKWKIWSLQILHLLKWFRSIENLGKFSYFCTNPYRNSRFYWKIDK